MLWRGEQLSFHIPTYSCKCSFRFVLSNPLYLYDDLTKWQVKPVKNWTENSCSGPGLSHGTESRTGMSNGKYAFCTPISFQRIACSRVLNILHCSFNQDGQQVGAGNHMADLKERGLGTWDAWHHLSWAYWQAKDTRKSQVDFLQASHLGTKLCSTSYQQKSNHTGSLLLAALILGSNLHLNTDEVLPNPSPEGCLKNTRFFPDRMRHATGHAI